VKYQPKVIGSEQPEITIVRQSPGQAKRRLVTAVVLFLSMGVLTYVAGYSIALFNQERASVQRDQLLGDVIATEAQLKELKRQLAFYQQEAEMSNTAVEIVRKENKLLLDQVSELEKANVLYHRVLTPEKDDKGLAIGQLELKTTSDKLRFRYNFNLMQVSGRMRVNGLVHVTLFGVIDGIKTEIKLNELPGSEASAKGISVGFRNFQSIDGELVLKEGFIPEQVEIVAQFSGRKTVRLRKVYDWLVEESNADVGQG